ncbi:MAG: hypothetical protein KUL86_06830 [Castellaniella sp.]|nr:hypothetical protein [Castellaniella sp.]
MTTKTDITLPKGITNHGIVGHDGPVYTDVMVQDIIRAAVEADRQGRMPSDEEIDKLSHGFALQYQDHVRGFAHALLSKYGNRHE